VRHFHQIIRAEAASSAVTDFVHKDALTRHSSMRNINSYRKIIHVTDSVHKTVYFVNVSI
jgi:hypothetical protein